MAAVEIYANQPFTTVTSGGTDAPVSGTVETWTVASSSEFPAASSTASPPTQFHVADVAEADNSELIAVTNVSGTTWTVTRGAESTTPVAHASGFTITQAVTAGALGALATLASPALTGTPAAPTASPLTDDTQIATTAYADAAVAVETSRAEAAEGLSLAKASNLSDVAAVTTSRANLAFGPYVDQDPANQAGLLGTAGITQLAAAIADRNSARCDIAIIGDSVTEGNGATTFTGRWIANANRAIRNAYPTTANGTAGGLGFIPIASTGETTYTWPVTGPADNYIGIGPVRWCKNGQSSAATYTWTAPAGTTSVKIMYYDSSASGSFTWQINSGSTTTITNGGTGDGKLSADIAITSGQVLTLAWASGNCFIEGIVHYASDESSGITLHGCGHYGWNSGTGTSGWLQTGPGYDWRPATAALASAAVGIMLGINDCQSTGGDFTASQYQTAMSNLITYLQGNASLANLPLLLIAEYQPDVTTVDPGGWPAYVAALRSLAAANSNTHVIDLSYRMPSVASDFDSGALYYDSVHPSNLGHALVGEIIAAGLRIA